MNKIGQVHIGTSGWIYPHWKGSFYPPDLPRKKWLSFYASRFHTAEINNSFYKLPTLKAIDNWRSSVPPWFIFAAKASRFLTHMKKLSDPRETIANFMRSIEPLAPKLGPILFQLPPGWRYNGDRLRAFLDLLPRNHRYAFEFRDDSWWNEEAYDSLRKYGIAFCIFQLGGQLSPTVHTADFIYLRLHGPDRPYSGGYDDEALSRWAQTFMNWSTQGKDVYCYFDNDEAGHAALNALTLQNKIVQLDRQRQPSSMANSRH